MSQPPTQPKLYHITRVENLPGMMAAGGLWSDAERLRQDVTTNLIGMNKIKQRRMNLPVACHPGTMVGEYVPFYFCPRSVMLYILSRNNHPEVNYRGGQDEIVHLQADLHAVVHWAQAQGVAWAGTVRNAGVEYDAGFFNDVNDLSAIDWQAVAASDFRSPHVSEKKQAEFLLHRFFPWSLVEAIGVKNDALVDTVLAHGQQAGHRLKVSQQSTWYY